MQTHHKRLKVLLSAYACEPNRGSEPGVGWEWASRLSKFHDVTVLTRSNNQTAITAAVEQEVNTPWPTFLYVDLPVWVLRLKQAGWCPVFVYYLLWQISARKTVDKLQNPFDLIHHVTFNGFRFPGAWWRRDQPVVLGPLGGGSIARNDYSKCFGPRWWIEKSREFSIRLWRWNPWTWASLRQAGAVLVVGEELRGRFSKLGINSQTMLETALPLDLESEPPSVDIHLKKHFVWVGNLEPWKAWQIALDAYAQAVSRGIGDSRLRILGNGSQLAKAVRRAKELGVLDRVDFLGPLPRADVWQMMASARALVFSSVRDTSGNVVLEAMGLRCPVICFRHQGVAMMTDEQCAIRIEPGSWQESVNGFASGMHRLASDDKLLEDMGQKGRIRAVEQFSWNTKVTAMLDVYSSLVSKLVPQ
jgi:glycosyltransferase involved in cell wall biosynthesis